MLVTNWMTRNVITADKNASTETAQKLIEPHGIRLLPVVEKKMLCGIITSRDIYKPANFKKRKSDLDDGGFNNKIAERMKKDVIAVPADYTVEETAELLIAKGIHGVPVINDKKEVIGIITKTDLLRAIVDLTGASRRGIQYAFEVEDRPGSIKELSDTIRSHGGRIASILTSCENVPDGYRKAYIRIYGIDRFRLRSLNEKLEEKATIVYMLDRLEIRKDKSTDKN